MASLLRVSGVYRISIARGDKPSLSYIGQASDIARRRSVHFWELNSGKHKNCRMQRAYAKYGSGAFKLEILETCDQADLARIEQKWLDAELANLGRGLVCNIRVECAVSGKGTKYSPETCRKISSALKGRIISEEWRARISAARKGQKLTEEQKARHSEILKKSGNMARVITPLQREIASRTHKGKTLSEAHRAAVRLAQTGRKQTAEAIEKSALKRRGRSLSEETRERIRQKALGRKLSPETIAKMNAGRAATRARKTAAAGSQRYEHERTASGSAGLGLQSADGG